MNLYANTRTLTAGLLVSLAMIVVPTAFAAGKPDDEHRQLGTAMAVDVPTDAVDRALVTFSPASSPSTMRDAVVPPVSSVFAAAPATGFDWTDAAVGAGATSALMLALIGAWAFAARRRSDTPSGVGASVVQH
jgi:hypothetical protein